MINVDKEISKCISCGICSKSCPVGINPKIMIELYKEKRFSKLATYLYLQNPFSGVCGYICPNKFCMNHCIRNLTNESVNIKGLHRIFSEAYFGNISSLEHKCITDKKPIAIVGGGVSGLSLAYYLSLNKIKVEIYEKNKTGGELWLINENRLPAKIISEDIKRILFDENIRVLHEEYNESNNKKYALVVDCTGSKPKMLEDISNVISFKDYIEERENNNCNIAIIGGGEVALECALRNSGKNTIFVRRNYWDMRIEEEDFEIIRKNHIQIVDNFELKNVLKTKDGLLKVIGTYKDNYYEEIFDKTVIAIGSEPTEIIPNTYKILPCKSVVETIAEIKKHVPIIIDKAYNNETDIQ